MTSPATHDETVDYFAANHFFGLPKGDVRFFTQGTMPAVHIETGRALLADKGSLALSPNGHGGALLALRDHGMLDELAERGVEVVHYFQVDNPLVKVLDPAFLGHHLLSEAEFSAKVVRKRDADEKLGVVVGRRGKPSVIEYSDLPDHLKRRTDGSGELWLWAGSIAIHVFSRRLLERLASESDHMLPFHIAKKRVPAINERGELEQPARENAIKFEMFIFDAMPLADRVTIVETRREEEFAPIKNAAGEDSPASAQAALARLSRQWLEACGVSTPTDPDGLPRVPIEISPTVGCSIEHFVEWFQSRRPLGDRSSIAEPTRFYEEDV
jgi:UDP-N-acetylglucosamine/UDP-N-acetylgalactosamine diphosphorylase